jgi:protein-disulfide isomerase
MFQRSKTQRGLGQGLGAVALLFLTAACGAPKAADAGTSDTKNVMATVGDIEITQADVEAAAGAQLKQLDQKRHELLEQALGGVIDEKLVEMEAKKRGVSKEELLAKEVTAKVTPVTDAEVDAFYTERQAQIRQPKEQIADRIKQFLGQNREKETYDAFVASLRGAYPVKTLFEPIRVEVAADGPSRGPAAAPVTIVEFSDFQCPFCSRVLPSIDEARANYGDKVRLVFRQFPLTALHPNAQKAAEAALCAHDQGKFWELHDAMFADQGGLDVPKLKEKAAAIGLDAEKFAACVDGGSKAAAVSSDVAAGTAAGVSGTPAMFVNGRFLNGAVPYEDLARVINDELQRKGVALPTAAAAAPAVAKQ